MGLSDITGGTGTGREHPLREPVAEHRQPHVPLPLHRSPPCPSHPLEVTRVPPLVTPILGGWCVVLGAWFLVLGAASEKSTFNALSTFATSSTFERGIKRAGVLTIYLKRVSPPWRRAGDHAADWREDRLLLRRDGHGGHHWRGLPPARRIVWMVLELSG